MVQQIFGPTNRYPRHNALIRLMSNDIQFGCLNVETGEFRTGYVDKSGNQRFKRLPWYKRLFCKEPSQTELVGTISISVGFIWTKDSDMKKAECAAYRKYNPFTGKTQKIWANYGDRSICFDPNVYDDSKRFVGI